MQQVMCCTAVSVLHPANVLRVTNGRENLIAATALDSG